MARFKIEVFKRKGGTFGFRRIAQNGKKTTPSQGYASRQGARRAARQQFPGTPVISVF